MQVLVIAVQNAVPLPRPRRRRPPGRPSSGPSAGRSAPRSSARSSPASSPATWPATWPGRPSRRASTALRRSQPRRRWPSCRPRSTPATSTPSRPPCIPCSSSPCPSPPVAFALTWLLKEVPLRKAASAPDPAQVLAPTAVPAARDSADEVTPGPVRARPEGRPAPRLRGTGQSRVGQPRSPLDMGTVPPRRPSPPRPVGARGDPGRHTRQLSALFAPLAGAGFVTITASAQESPLIAQLTPAGTAAIERLVRARQQGLTQSPRQLVNRARLRSSPAGLQQLTQNVLRDPARRDQFLGVLAPAPAGSP